MFFWRDRIGEALIFCSCCFIFMTYLPDEWVGDVLTIKGTAIFIAPPIFLLWRAFMKRRDHDDLYARVERLELEAKKHTRPDR